MGVVGTCTRLQTVAWSLSVINTLKQPRAMCSDAVCGALVVWQRDGASLNVRVHTRMNNSKIDQIIIEYDVHYLMLI